MRLIVLVNFFKIKIVRSNRLFYLTGLPLKTAGCLSLQNSSAETLQLCFQDTAEASLQNASIQNTGDVSLQNIALAKTMQKLQSPKQSYKSNPFICLNLQDTCSQNTSQASISKTQL